MTIMDRQNDDKFRDGILGITNTLDDIHNRAVVAYTPLVDDICSRKATKEEVGNLLTWMFDFVENERILLLFKKVCSTYFNAYPETIGFYILEYRKEYDRESLKGTQYEYLLEGDKELYEE